MYNEIFLSMYINLILSKCPSVRWKVLFKKAIQSCLRLF